MSKFASKRRTSCTERRNNNGLADVAERELGELASPRTDEPIPGPGQRSDSVRYFKSRKRDVDDRLTV